MSAREALEFVAAMPFDGIGASEIQDYFDAWCFRTSKVEIETDTLDSYYHSISARSLFFKSSPQDAIFLDMGAGNGALSIYKKWPQIERQDIRLYGVSLDPVEMASEYEAVAIIDFEKTPVPFTGVTFDAVLASHFIEHLRDVRPFVQWIFNVLGPGGRVYLEWPHRVSKSLPGREFFLQREIPVFTTNFFDDDTHIEAWPMEHLLEVARDIGFLAEVAGRLHSPYLSGHLRDKARNNKNIVSGTFAVWSAVGWAQYLILNKPF